MATLDFHIIEPHHLLFFFPLLLLVDEFNITKELHACQKNSQCRVVQSKKAKSFTLTHTHRGTQVSNSLQLCELPFFTI